MEHRDIRMLYYLPVCLWIALSQMQSAGRRLRANSGSMPPSLSPPLHLEMDGRRIFWRLSPLQKEVGGQKLIEHLFLSINATIIMEYQILLKLGDFLSSISSSSSASKFLNAPLSPSNATPLGNIWWIFLTVMALLSCFRGILSSLASWGWVFSSCQSSLMKVSKDSSMASIFCWEYRVIWESDSSCSSVWCLNKVSFWR